MKNRILKNTLLFVLGVILLPLINSCETDEDVRQPVDYQKTWKDDFKLEFNPVGEDATGTFQYNIELQTGQEFWGITDIEYEVTLNTGDFLPSDINNIKLYVFAEEKTGDSHNYIGDNEGFLLETINNPSETFQLSVSKDQMQDTFGNLFISDRNGDILPDDIFELKWVVTGNDGEVLDTRKDCFGFNCTYGFGTQINYVDTWVGEFSFNWIDVGSDSCIYSWGDICNNPTGTVLFSVNADIENRYDVADLSMGASYGAARPGTIDWDPDTSTITVTDPSFWSNNWELESVTDEVLTINWTYYYSQWYSENGTVEITRTDGLSWPTNLTIINAE